MTEEDAPSPARKPQQANSPGAGDASGVPAAPRSERHLAGDDFLFHLYRGSELLQDNRVHEAKQELEHALSLQPRDEKGQDLLALVYFRLGLYPRAIAIYESLIAVHPESATPRVNLALCYLKTGQASGARAELERVLELNPRHSRAWGYLGLAFQRLGDYERAYHAFLTGGHDAMGRRLMEMLGVSPRDAERAVRYGADGGARDLIGQAASGALDRIDNSPSGAPAFHAEAEESRRSASGTWAAVEPGRDPSSEEAHARPLTPSLVPSLAPSESMLPPAIARDSLAPPREEESLPRDTDERAEIAQEAPPSAPEVVRVVRESRFPSIIPHVEPPDAPETFVRKLLLLFPRLHRAALHPSGLVVMKVNDACGVRFDMVRSLSFPSGMQTRLLTRRTRGKEVDEPLGGTTSQLQEIAGTGELVLGPSVGTRLSVLAIGNDPLSIRESALAAFDASVLYESGKLATSEGDAVPLVVLRSAWAFDDDPTDASGAPALRNNRTSVVVLSLPPTVASLEVTEVTPALVRAHSVLGWTGRITPRNLPPSEAPGKARGFIALSGEGMVLVDGR